MAATLNAFNSSTAKNFELDAGILVTGVTNPGSLDYSTGTKLGATAGGTTATFSNEIRNLFEDVDGARGSYKDGDIIDMQDGSVTFTLLEQTAANMKLALAAADITINTAGGETITPRDSIISSDYYANICWFGTVKGSDLPMCIEIRNALNESGLNFTAADKAKGTIECEIHGRKDVADPTAASMLIHLPPTGEATISSVVATSSTVTITLNSKPTAAPITGDFTATESIDGAAATAISLSGFTYDDDVTVVYAYTSTGTATDSVVVAVTLGGSSTSALAFTV